jgi:hypothetical protein
VLLLSVVDVVEKLSYVALKFTNSKSHFENETGFLKEGRVSTG